MKNKLLIAVLAIALIATSLTLYFVFKSSDSSLGSEITLNGQQFDIELADTPEKRVKGLSNRTSLDENQGMLFVFESPAIECFWMKDMKFSIDILWFDENRKLIHKQANLTPETYPASYCPPTPAKYVLELAAGRLEKLDLDNDVTFEFVKQ